MNMTKTILFYIAKTFFVLVLILVLFYLFILKPRLKMTNQINNTQEILRNHQTILIQNRILMTGLTQLDESTASFNQEKSNIVDLIKESNEKGRAELNIQDDIFQTVADSDSEFNQLNQQFPNLVERGQDIYERQGILLDKVFTTKTFVDGVKTISSSESVELLTDQTNLILEYSFWIDRLESSKPSNFSSGGGFLSGLY